MSKSLAPFGYYGGKGAMLDFIIDHLPPGENFLDLFGGSAVVSLSVVGKYRQVVYNDINERLVSFFRTLRDHPDEVIWKVDMTPSSRTDFENCFEISDDPIEDARRVFALINQSFMKKGLWQKNGWQFHGMQKGRSSASFLQSRKERLPAVANVLQNMDIENRDWRVLVKHPKKHTVIFADPPYDLDVRSGGKGYQHEFTEQDHIDLANALTKSPAMAVVCGYGSDLYNDLYANWIKREKVVGCNFNSTEGEKTKQTRTECIWMKDDYSTEDSIF